eukprot:CAMPEP_0197178966 /NCGR_PEP_ID=MMETSP1423-20130617/4067_1 /TAXON_ID=476441 /ORGANISM="Pseudo-nitzschia heimii, Strain UNC1101" /LENGTH=590 /DNA_ID=CAMNT_0042628793 /DNA_START=100 /DNA_END=1872 /DNA_ORIENTATION=-
MPIDEGVLGFGETEVTVRLGSKLRSRPTRASVSTTLMKRRKSLAEIAIMLCMLICYKSTNFLCGSIGLLLVHHSKLVPTPLPVHAFVTHVSVRQKQVIGQKLKRRSIANAAAKKPLQYQNQPFPKSIRLSSKQQSDADIVIDSGLRDHPMPAIATGTENNSKSTRRCFLSAAGTITGIVVTTSALSPSCSIASASSMDPIARIDERSGTDTTAEDPAPLVFEYTEDNRSMITIPLAFTGQELLVAYKVDGSTFKAVLDTGSPFLMIPGSCGLNTRQKSGCYENQGKPVPKLTPTIEIFDGFQGEVNWRSAPFEFWDLNNDDSIPTASTSATSTSDSMPTRQTQQRQKIPLDENRIAKKQVVFGVASEAIMGGPGGVFFGMIRDTDARIRPSFLGQTDVRAFRVNLATRPRTLTLSNRDLIASSTDSASSEIDNASMVDYIPMTNLLRRRYGDPVGHYTAAAKSMYVNGFPLVDTAIDPSSKLLVIFDTGVTGMVVSRALFDAQYTLARNRREKTLFGNVELNFTTILGRESVIRARKPLATPFDPEQTWKKFPKRREGRKNTVHIIVMGLAFLEDRSLTVDIDGERIWVE